MVVAVLFNAGLQTPVIPLRDIVGNAVSVAPEQIGATALNNGVICVVIIIPIVVEAVQPPPDGVNVYVVIPTVAVLIVAGLHVPLTPLVEVTGNAGAVEF